MTVSLVDLDLERREEFLELMREVYGSSMSAEEFEWFFRRSPVREPLLSSARDDTRLLGVLAMVFARALVGEGEELVVFAVHAATHPASRGRGIFSSLEYRNEEKAEAAGAPLALGFTNPLAGPIYVRKLGWRDLYRMRLWARPLRPLRALRRRGGGGLPPSRSGTLERFGPDHEQAWRRVAPAWGNCLVRSPEYLNWRYLDAPKDYRAFGSANGYAVVGHAVQKGVSAAVICDLVAPPREQRALVRRCLREARGGADVAIAVPAPDQRRAFLTLGFFPTPMTIRVIGKALRSGVELPDRWHFTPGDTDFF